MKKIFKISILFTIVCFFILTSVNAFSINMNLENFNTTDTINIEEETISEDNPYEYESLNADTTINNEETDDSSPVITTTVSDEDEFLTVENILSIIIIVIGILLILLAIAILIRFK